MTINVRVNEKQILRALTKGIKVATKKNIENTKNILKTSQPDIYTDRRGALSKMLEEAGLPNSGGELKKVWNGMISQIETKSISNNKIVINIFDSMILDRETKWIGKSYQPKFRNDSTTRGSNPNTGVPLATASLLKTTGGTNVIDGFRPLPAATGGRWTWATNPYKGQGYWRIYEDGYISTKGKYGISYQPHYFIRSIYSVIFHNAFSAMFTNKKLKFSKKYLDIWKKNITNEVNRRLRV